MKVTFIKPNIGRREHSLYVDEGRMEPLMLGVLAGLTPPDVDVVMYDDRMESIPFDEAADLVAITIETYTARRAYEIAAEYRQRGVPVIMGGMHATLLPEEVAQHADSIFIGDAETLWAQVVEDARRHKLQTIYQAPPGIAQLNNTLPRREIYQGKGYLPMSLMQFTRGCRFACSFCAVSKYFNKTHYIRRVDEVVREIAEQERKFVFFIDDNIATDRKALKELCSALIPLRINWISQASLDVTRDLELMKLMADSGCIGHVMGFESITRASLRDARKAPNLPGFTNYDYEVKVLRDHGMQTWAAFTLGYDNDTYDSILATMEFALQNRFTFAAFNILMPYPNTPLYSKLQKENRLLYDGKWWLHPEYRFNDAAFIPANMTPDELTEACHKARQKFNSIFSLLYRFSDVKTNLRSLWRAASYWRYTTLFRKEVYKKHKMRFGFK
ncbi:MAG: B12-binding domain-containing radical SAM protein [Gammaproteobacteria bacterium]|nr:B12-binding domain-containing radical SAM protein [Gammaproteobacteria bacterium]MDH5651960.1 B12-binding domain-containing radical SAM protein [Gammaproteobacteria bacterium]